jgi:hypothetical protein
MRQVLRWGFYYSASRFFDRRGRPCAHARLEAELRHALETTGQALSDASGA